MTEEGLHCAGPFSYNRKAVASRLFVLQIFLTHSIPNGILCVCTYSNIEKRYILWRTEIGFWNALWIYFI